MNQKDFGDACVRDFGKPYTKSSDVLDILRLQATIVAEVYYDWGNGIDHLKDCMWPLLESVVYANKELLTDAGYIIPEKKVKHELISPVLDFRDINFFHEDEWLSRYHEQLEALAYNDISGFGAADQVGEEFIVTFPAWYDVWLQAVVTSVNAFAVLEDLRGMKN